MRNHGELNYRAFQRKECQLPVRFSVGNSEKFQHARVVNSSDGGMYIECDSPVDASSDLYIEIIKDTPRAAALPLKACRAEVRWCRKMHDNGSKTYGIGIRFLSDLCHQCGDRILPKDIDRSDSMIRLCPDCREDHEMLHGFQIQNCIRNYLMGNVI